MNIYGERLMNFENKIDVIVVGGGPAGIAAAGVIADCSLTWSSIVLPPVIDDC